METSSISLEEGRRRLQNHAKYLGAMRGAFLIAKELHGGHEDRLKICDMQMRVLEEVLMLSGRLSDLKNFLEYLESIKTSQQAVLQSPGIDRKTLFETNVRKSVLENIQEILRADSDPSEEIEDGRIFYVVRVRREKQYREDALSFSIGPIEEFERIMTHEGLGFEIYKVLTETRRELWKAFGDVLRGILLTQMAERKMREGMRKKPPQLKVIQ